MLRIKRLEPVLVVLVFLTPVIAQAGGRPVTEQEFTDWVLESAIELDPLRTESVSPEDLGQLDRGIDGTRIVFLGEPDHYIQEKYDYRMTLIRYLVGRGFRYIGMEMGVSDGTRIDMYLESGDERELDRVALYGYRDDLRDDREDMLSMFTTIGDPEFTDAFVCAEREFLREVRLLSETLENDRLHWFGFDIDVVPGGGYADVSHLLAGCLGNPVVARLSSGLERVPGESRMEEVDRLNGALEFAGQSSVSLTAVLGQRATHQVIDSIRCLAESITFIDLALTPPFNENFPAAIAMREEILRSRLDNGWLTALPTDARLILMGHNMHLNRHSTTLRSGAAGTGAAVPVPESIGSAVADRESVFALWMLYDHGTSVDPLGADPVISVPSQRDRIEYWMAKVGPGLILPLESRDRRARYLAEPRNFVMNGRYSSGNLLEEIDAIYFVREVSAIGESGGTNTGNVGL